MFEVKHDGRHKVCCAARANRVKQDHIDVTATTAQNSTVRLMLLALVQKEHEVIIANAENAYSNAETVEKVCTELRDRFRDLSHKLV